MTARLETGLITPPYSTSLMNHYSPSAKSNSAVSDLCAQTVCFLWFESLPTIHEAATTNHPYYARIPDVDSVAKPDFIKWTREVLSTTQVSVNVVILAMLFIYRLKIANPNVKGKAGSEYRLLTVALMLGNKFLDDNTYTNKTWAQVTAIDVKEIHMMEVEFLSNMRYQLMVCVEEWQQWLIKINMFLRYQEGQRKSLKYPIPMALPSPPSVLDAQHFAHAPACWQVPVQITPPYVEVRGRKRSLGDEYFPEMFNMLPPSKRMVSSYPSTPNSGLKLVQRPSRYEQSRLHEVSPSKLPMHAAAAAFRCMPGHNQNTKLLIPSMNLSHPQQTLGATGSNYSTHSSSLSPSYLQVGTQTSLGSSPTTSPISQYSNPSHGPTAMNLSPSSKALQKRNSPYAPVQPVQRLVGHYHPVYRSPQRHPVSKESLWYSQLTAGEGQPIYNGRVPLTAQNSPFYYPPRH